MSGTMCDNATNKYLPFVSILPPPLPFSPPYSLDPLRSRQFPRLQHQSTHPLRVGKLGAGHNLFFRHGVAVHFLKKIGKEEEREGEVR